jgi:hypothetical protein
MMIDPTPIFPVSTATGLRCTVVFADRSIQLVGVGHSWGGPSR